MSAFWIAVLVSIIPLWLLQNVIHELSHGLTMWFGWKWKFSIYPFPSRKLGRFTFAHVTYEQTDESTEPDENGLALVSIMPKIVNTLFMAIAGIIAVSLTGFEILPAILLVFVWCNFVDFTFGLLGIFRSKRKSDIWKFRDHLDMPIGYLKFSVVGLVCWFGVIISLITLIILLS